MTDQRLMRLSAEFHALKRSAREGIECRVYRRVGHPAIEDVTWYVRAPHEGEPEGATLELVVKPEETRP